MFSLVLNGVATYFTVSEHPKVDLTLDDVKSLKISSYYGGSRDDILTYYAACMLEEMLSEKGHSE